MRIPFFILLLFICQVAFTQPSLKGKPDLKKKTSRPSEAEMQAQWRQAKLEAQQQIIALENQIAEEKKKNENPETVQELENQLATMKQMAAMMEQVGTLNTKRVKFENTDKPTTPRYVSPIVPIVLKKPVVIPTKAQAKDLLLWYRGKKIDANTLVTTSGMVVRYDRSNNRVIVRPDEERDSTFKVIVKNLAKCRQWTEQYVDRVTAETNSFFNYPQVIITLREFEFIERAYNDIVKNTIPLPQSLFIVTAESFNLYDNTSNGPLASTEIVFIDSVAKLKQLHQELLDYMKEPRPPIVDAPPPPKKEFELCTYCHVNVQQEYRDKKNQWQQGFLDYELKLLDKMKAVAAWLTLMGSSEGIAAIPGIESDLKNAQQIAFERWDQKIADLEHLWGRDIQRMEVVLENMLLVEREKKIYYGEEDESYTAKIKNRIKIYLDLFIKYFEEQMVLKNYDVVFNTSLLMGTELHHRILGKLVDGVDAITRVMDFIDKIKAFNRFALTVELDYRVTQTGEGQAKPVIEAYGKVVTDPAQKTYLSLGRLGDCGWQLYLTGTDYSKHLEEETFKIPMKVDYGTKDFNTLYTEYTSSYSGPREMQLILPSFRISFCNNNNRDSVIMGLIGYKPEEDLSIYTIDEKHYTTDLLQHVNKMFASAVKTKDMAVDITATITAVSNISAQATVDQPTGYRKVDKMQVEFKMNDKHHGIQKTLAELTHFGNTILYFNATNSQAILIDINIDIPNTELEDKYNLTKGVRKLKVEHDPQ